MMKMPEVFTGSMMPWIGKTMKHIDLFISTKLKEQGIDLTRQQVVMMLILSESGPQPQNNCAFLTDRDKTSLTRLINVMEKKNIVARIPSQEDKRVNIIHLTKNGEAVLASTLPILGGIMKKLQNDIPQEKQDIVIEVMKQIQENVKSQL
jgi:DNA-binding MarR family transcriptional regulator